MQVQSISPSVHASQTLAPDGCRPPGRTPRPRGFRSCTRVQRFAQSPSGTRPARLQPMENGEAREGGEGESESSH
eukprot:scaffold5138_cov251-Pinguiococcus_pyrenoidosus.AAC.5